MKTVCANNKKGNNLVGRAVIKYRRNMRMRSYSHVLILVLGSESKDI